MVTSVGGEEQANEIASELVLRRQAACVNLMTGVRSFYRWKGKVCNDSEFLLIIKTMKSEYEAVAATIRELHSYEVPEILAFDVSQGDQGFLDWIDSSLDKNADFEDEQDLPDLDAL
ncbi:MAG: divalent-cation tolerance protein CutA [Acidobacteriota bacterium]